MDIETLNKSYKNKKKQPDLGKIARLAKRVYHVSIVTRFFINNHNDVDEFHDLRPLMDMLHKDIDRIYGELIETDVI